VSESWDEHLKRARALSADDEGDNPYLDCIEGGRSLSPNDKAAIRAVLDRVDDNQKVIDSITEVCERYGFDPENAGPAPRPEKIWEGAFIEKMFDERAVARAEPRAAPPEVMAIRKWGNERAVPASLLVCRELDSKGSRRSELATYLAAFEQNRSIRAFRLLLEKRPGQRWAVDAHALPEADDCLCGENHYISWAGVTAMACPSEHRDKTIVNTGDKPITLEHPDGDGNRIRHLAPLPPCDDEVKREVERITSHEPRARAQKETRVMLNLRVEPECRTCCGTGIIKSSRQERARSYLCACVESRQQ
jgi:hypothetical protein